MAIQTSYDLSNQKRSFQEGFLDLITTSNHLLGMITVGEQPTNIKHEWDERQLTPSTYTITAFTTDGDGVSMEFASTTGILVGDIFKFVSSTGADRDELLRVTVIDSSVKITTARDYAGSPGATLVVGDVGRLMKPAIQGKKVTAMTATAGTQPTANYNYEQIADRLVEVSKDREMTDRYGIVNGKKASSIWDQVEQKEREMMWEISTSLFHGYRAVGSATIGGMAGGIRQFAVAGGNVVGASAAAVSLDLINQAGALTNADGAGVPPVLVMHTTQKRNLAKLNTSGTNPITMISRDEVTAGTTVEIIQSDITGVSTIIIDDNMAEDMIIGFNPAFTNINYYEGMTEYDGSISNADDVISRALRVKWTFTHLNGKANYIIKELAI
jgi:hypothetical protein